MVFGRVFLSVLAFLAVAAAGGAANASYTIYYHQDGRRLNSIADARALIASTAPVAVQRSNILNITDARTSDGNFRSSVTTVPLSNQENFAVYAVGSVQFDQTGDYTINVFSDDGFELSINGVRVAGFSSPRAPASTTTTDVFLTAGRHDIEVVYYERTGRAVLEVSQAFGNVPTFSAGAFDLTVSTAPEPSAWALMIAGFAGLAARLKAARRRAGLRPGREFAENTFQLVN